MKKYTEEDIKVVDWDAHVKKNPTMYYGDKEISPEELGKAIEYSALILGAKKLSNVQIDDWWYFCSDVDWLFKSTYRIKSVVEVFNGPCPFPEAEQQNAFRTEAVVLPFVTDAFTIANDQVVTLKGTVPSKSTIKNIVNKLGEWERIVAYKTNA